MCECACVCKFFPSLTQLSVPAESQAQRRTLVAFWRCWRSVCSGYRKVEAVYLCSSLSVRSQVFVGTGRRSDEGETYEIFMIKISFRENFPYFSTLFYRVDELRDFLESCESYRFLLSITVGTFMQVCVPGMTYGTDD